MIVTNIIKMSNLIFQMTTVNLTTVHTHARGRPGMSSCTGETSPGNNTRSPGCSCADHRVLITCIMWWFHLTSPARASTYWKYSAGSAKSRCVNAGASRVAASTGAGVMIMIGGAPTCARCRSSWRSRVRVSCHVKIWYNTSHVVHIMMSDTRQWNQVAASCIRSSVLCIMCIIVTTLDGSGNNS